jgi:enoyl-[acyl-carrier-protein] reductase (NADH)
MTGLMQGKRGLIMGVANDHSIAWGIAKTLAAQGADLAFTYQGESLKKRVEPLAKEAGSDFLLPCDVEDLASVDALVCHRHKHVNEVLVSARGVTRRVFRDRRAEFGVERLEVRS